MINHSQRAHAFLSASSAHRWLVCTPSARLEESFPDTSSEAAREGTIAHELAEAKLRKYFDTQNFGTKELNKRIKELQKEDLWNDEMLRYTDVYVDYIKNLAMSCGTLPSARIELQFSLKDYIPDGFGTADFVMFHGEDLYVVDFKYGQGKAVSAENNPQMMLYALGAYESLKILFGFKNIHLAIVQPRKDILSEWSCSIDDLLAFGEYVKDRARLAYDGAGDYAPGEAQCMFCRAKAQCRARADENVRLAFSPDMGVLPPLISDDLVGQYLKQGEMVAAWLSDLKDYALKACLDGKEIPGWKAVEGRSSRSWTDMDKAFAKLLSTGLTAEVMLYEKKPLTLAQVEKLVGKKDFADCVGEYVVKSPGKPTLVEESDKREAITNRSKAEEAFKED